MRALLVVPDYVSHWNPLSAVAAALTGRGHDVVVATGPALGPRVEADGFAHVQLRLGAGSNPGVSRSVRNAELDGFFAATHAGMVATLRYQAERRRHDLLWEPQAVAERVREVIEDVAPDATLVDQLAFGATAALRGLRVPFVSFLPGHPCQLPARGETFGYPTLRPPRFTAREDELASLAELCRLVTLEFTAVYNAAVSALDPEADALEDAFAAGGTAGTLVNYPEHLGGYAARRPHVGFVGSCVRAEQADATIAGLDRGLRERPRAYVSLGSFLSARTDVLRSVADALRMLGWDAVIATGATDPADLGPAPSSWVLAEHIPQIAALQSCDLVVCHGGNNTVTEALTAGLPLLALPFSTDQFAGAEDVRRGGLGDAAVPGVASAAEIASRLTGLLEGPAASKAEAFGRGLRSANGAERVADVVERVGARVALLQ